MRNALLHGHSSLGIQREYVWICSEERAKIGTVDRERVQVFEELGKRSAEFKRGWKFSFLSSSPQYSTRPPASLFTSFQVHVQISQRLFLRTSPPRGKALRVPHLEMGGREGKTRSSLWILHGSIAEEIVWGWEERKFYDMYHSIHRYEMGDWIVM